MLKIGILFALASIFTAFYSCAPSTAPALPEATMSSSATAIPGQAATGWEAEWGRILKAAIKEGKVVIYGPPIPDVRQGFTDAFQKAYPGIILDYTGLTTNLAPPKINAERRAGLYAEDMVIGGTTTMLNQLRSYALPINQFLILPEVTNPKLWLGGQLDYSDDAREINLVFTIESSPRVIYNPNFLNPADVTSWWDLTKPKFKEKIIMWDPRIAGSGLATATFWYFQTGLGLDFIKAFAANQPVLTRDLRLQVETVGRGKYALGVSPDPPTVLDLQKAGMPLKWPKILKEGTYSSAAYGSTIIMSNAPHPNAAIVFLNWMLGKEGQNVWSKGSGFASRRLDVPTDFLDEALRPDPNADYQPNYKEKYVLAKDEILGQLNEIFRGF